MAKKKGKWVYVPDSPQSPEEIKKEQEERVLASLSTFRSPDHPFAVIDQWQDYFPEGNAIPEGGAWVLIKIAPPTEYTVPPLSLWFAEPWPMEPTGGGRKRVRAMPAIKRVKIVTPRGELGLFPREYVLVNDPQKYYEFIGEGMDIKFFSGDLAGLPEDKLFYLRSRGVSKKDAIAMLIGEIKAHGVCWVETRREIADAFVREWPDESRLATINQPKEQS